MMVRLTPFDWGAPACAPDDVAILVGAPLVGARFAPSVGAPLVGARFAPSVGAPLVGALVYQGGHETRPYFNAVLIDGNPFDAIG
jgi:hypothetical protein